MMIRILFIVFCLSPVFLRAQSDSISTDRVRLAFPKYRIGYSPTAMVHWLPAIQFSGDAALKEDLNLTAELGYIYHGRPLDFFSARSPIRTNGVQVRTGLEFAISRGSRSIFALGLYYVRKAYTYYELNWVQVREHGYRKLEEVSTSVSYDGFAMGFNWGIKLSDTFFLDLGTGFGRANRNTSTSNSPDSDMSDAVFYINANVAYTFASK